MLVVNPLWGSSTAEPGLTTSNLLSKATMHSSSILRSRRDLTLLSDFHDCAGSVTWAPPPRTADAPPKGEYYPQRRILRRGHRATRDQYCRRNGPRAKRPWEVFAPHRALSIRWPRSLAGGRAWASRKRPDGRRRRERRPPTAGGRG